jgi:PEGA domain
MIRRVQLMRQFPGLLVVAVCAGLLTGCVDRRYVITSDPPGAVVYVNNRQIGATPADEHFIYYGDYEFLLVKDGYQTKRVVQNIPAPWYEYFPLDFFAENVWPFREIDVRRFNYELEPLPAVRTDVLIDEAQNLRKRGLAITPPPANTNGPRPFSRPPNPVPPPFVGPPEPPPNVPPPIPLVGATPRPQ